MLKYPFKASFDEILKDSGRYIDAVFACLESEFLIMPKEQVLLFPLTDIL